MPRSVAAQVARALEVRLSYEFNYLLYRPRGFAARGRRRWPLMIFLHGRGESGRDLALVEKHGPPKLIAAGRAFPGLVVSPQCPADQWWNYLALDAFVGAVMQRYPVDPARVYLTGLSMGGFATWALAAMRPQRYAAIAPICGGGDVRHAELLRNLPVWAFHGARDAVIPLRRSREMIDRIRAVGGKPRFTIYPDALHDAWTKPYGGTQLYDWLFSHRLRPGARHESGTLGR